MCMYYVRDLLGLLETRLAQNTFNYPNGFNRELEYGISRLHSPVSFRRLIDIATPLWSVSE